MIIIITDNIGLSSSLLVKVQPQILMNRLQAGKVCSFFSLKNSTINSQILLSSINPEVLIL